MSKKTAEDASSNGLEVHTPTNGVADAGPAKAPPVRQSWSSPIQGMAKIEAVMNGLAAKQQGIVARWFFDTYIAVGECTLGSFMETLKEQL